VAGEVRLVGSSLRRVSLVFTSSRTSVGSDRQDRQMGNTRKHSVVGVALP
jgi:hypothetical protein